MKRNDLRNRYARPRPVESTRPSSIPPSTYREMTETQLREINGLELMKCTCDRKAILAVGHSGRIHHVACPVWQAVPLKAPPKVEAPETTVTCEQCPLCDHPGAFEMLPSGRWHCCSCNRAGETVAELQAVLEVNEKPRRPIPPGPRVEIDEEAFKKMFEPPESGVRIKPMTIEEGLAEEVERAIAEAEDASAIKSMPVTYTTDSTE